MTKLRATILFISSILLIDQISKVWIKLNMRIGQEFIVFPNWFRIHFTENNGMAFGMEFGGEYGKIALSLFRIIAVCFIAWYIYKLSKKETSQGILLGIAAIFAGAMGNIIDSLFYGLLFSESTPFTVATFLPEAGGYASFMHGKVVDMFYFPLFVIRFPEWLPLWGGEYFEFFQPVFNVADSAITCGVTYMLIFQRNFLKKL
ncbi:MAG: lipoprotein signal peptidase [Bacteroidales bacterium]